MFESAEIGHKIDKKIYKEEVPELRASLIEAQFNLVQAAKFPVIILVGGVDGAGRSETVNLLSEWMDPRPHFRSTALVPPPTKNGSVLTCGGSGGYCPPRAKSESFSAHGTPTWWKTPWQTKSFLPSSTSTSTRLCSLSTC